MTRSGFYLLVIILISASLIIQTGCGDDDPGSSPGQKQEDDDDDNDDDSAGDDDSMGDDDAVEDDDDDDNNDDNDSGSDDDDDDDNDDDDNDTCLTPEADCFLGETAGDAGLFAGVAVPADIADPRMAVVPTHWNSVTAENSLKWGSLSPTYGDYDFTQADALVDWMEDQGLRIRGHALVWGKYPGHGHPRDLEALIQADNDPKAFALEAIRNHITTVVGRYAGRIETWDVVNEPLSAIGSGFEPNLFYDAAGIDYIAEAFNAARDADNSAQLVLNEYFNGYQGPKPAAFLALLDELIDRDVPIDGVGIQGHVYLTAPRPEVLLKFMADIAARGLTVEFTELDVAKPVLIDDIHGGEDWFTAQADVYRVFAEACVATPACRGMTVWGIDDSDSWLDHLFFFEYFAPNNPLLLDRDLAPKPGYYALREAFKER